MMERTHAYVLYVLIGSIWFFPFELTHPEIPYFVSEVDGNHYAPGTILFTGDILLGRRIETMGNTLGASYPFLKTLEVLRNADVTIGNFEASIPEKHIPTPDLTFQFSVKEEYLKVLKEVGFDALSFANNHAYDYGEKAYHHGLESCKEVELLCIGHPYKVSTGSITTMRVGSSTVGILFLHGSHVDLNATTTNEVLSILNSSSDFQIAFVHWGAEYVRTHNKAQAQLAHALIDQGIDGIIGHHPHVVQDFEIYKNKFIAYSLGNFVFDQYFSEDVQKGILVKLTLRENEVVYTLIPVTSLENRSQPKPMNEEESAEFLDTLEIIGYEIEQFRKDRGVVLKK